MTHKLRRPLAAILFAGLLAAGLAACGGSSGSASTTAATGAQFQARLDLAKCFRSHGVNVPDPSTNGGPGEGVGRVLRTYPQAQIQAAMTACRQYLVKAFPQLNLTPAQRAQRRQQLVKFAECMRSHGINIPDPTTAGSGPGGGFGFARQFRSIDRNSPAFQAANKACASLRPQFGRGGPGGPGAAAPGGGAGASTSGTAGA
jgi:hypothetical protein